MEIKTVLTPVRVEQTCDTCGGGVMRHTGVTLTPHPPLYSHHCTLCGVYKNYSKTYPCIEFIDKE